MSSMIVRGASAERTDGFEAVRAVELGLRWTHPSERSHRGVPVIRQTDLRPQDCIDPSLAQ
jgi:hypothetical protein